MNDSQKQQQKQALTREIKNSKVSYLSQVNGSLLQEEQQETQEADQQQQQHNNGDLSFSKPNQQHSFIKSQKEGTATNNYYSPSNYVAFTAETDHQQRIAQTSVQEFVRYLEDGLKPSIQGHENKSINNQILDEEEKRLLEEDLAKGNISVVPVTNIRRRNAQSKMRSQSSHMCIYTNQFETQNKSQQKVDNSQASANAQYTVPFEEIQERAKSQSGQSLQLISSVQQFCLYRRRYVIATLFTLSLAVLSILQSATTPIAPTLQKLYGESAVVISLAPLLFYLMHPLFTVPASYLIEIPKWGVRIATCTGGTLVIIGTWLRCLVGRSFLYLILGSGIIGVGRVFFVNQMTKLSVNWFAPEDRATMTGIFNFGLIAAGIIGTIIPKLVYGNYQYIKNDAQNNQAGRDHTYNIMLIEAILTTICFIPSMIFLHGDAPSPPSFAAVAKKAENIKQSLIILFKNRNFLVLAISYALYFGMFKAVFAVLSYMLAPYPYNLTDITIFSIAPVISGFITNVIIGQVLKKHQHYKIFSCVISILTIVILLTQYPMARSGNVWIEATNLVFLGAVALPNLPIIMELTMEITYPCGESISLGILLSGAQTLGFAFGEIASFILNNESDRNTLYTLIFFAAVNIVSFFILLFVRQELNRQEAEKRRKKIIQKLSEQISKSPSRDQFRIIAVDFSSSQKISYI